MLRITIATVVAGALVAFALWLIPDDEIDPHNLSQVDQAALVDGLRPGAKSANFKAQYALAQHYLTVKGVK